jgi:SAM-dependent methyltransferase
MKPVVLDLFCGAGGAAAGYKRAGFNVVGVDIEPQPDYAGHAFVQADALLVAKSFVNALKPALVHASPPCQGYTALKAVHGNAHPLLIPKTRDMLNSFGVPYVIENVAGAPIRKDMMLCGEMFGLGVIMHRYFELGLWKSPWTPLHVPHKGRVRGWRHGVWIDGPYVQVHGKGGGKATVDEARAAKRINWTTNWQSLCDAIPPDYTDFIGGAFSESVRAADDARRPPQPGPDRGAVDSLPVPRPRRPQGVSEAQSR